MCYFSYHCLQIGTGVHLIYFGIQCCFWESSPQPFAIVRMHFNELEVVPSHFLPHLQAKIEPDSQPDSDCQLLLLCLLQHRHWWPEYTSYSCTFHNLGPHTTQSSCSPHSQNLTHLIFQDVHHRMDYHIISLLPPQSPCLLQSHLVL